MTALAPGSTIGIMGGGQLGRMLAVAAAQLGYRCHIYAPEEHSVAAEVAADWTRAEFDDADAVRRFAASCDVVTYEFENVPVAPLALIGDQVPLRPGPKALEIAQSRIAEKEFARDCGGQTADFAVVESLEDLNAAMENIGAPSILKTTRFGYDGKGQVRLRGGEAPKDIWQEIGEQPSILEAMVDFSHEFSVIAARGLDGATCFWDSAHNIHKDGILDQSLLPAPAAVLDQVSEARELARTMAEAMDYIGVLTCEFFVTANGPVFNEMAPRVHNSGHWSIEGAVTSQFENHIRAIVGLPLGDTAMTAPQVTMQNLIGGNADAWQSALGDPAVKLHLYGKTESRPGRKMGHWTKLSR